MIQTLHLLVASMSGGLLLGTSLFEKNSGIRWLQRILGVTLIILSGLTSTLLCGGCL